VGIVLSLNTILSKLIIFIVSKDISLSVLLTKVVYNFKVVAYKGFSLLSLVYS
jgi:hypothetical protein